MRIPDMDPAVREKRMEELLLEKKARLAALIDEARANPKTGSKEADRFRAAFQHAQAVHQRWFEVYRAAGELQTGATGISPACSKASSAQICQAERCVAHVAACDAGRDPRRQRRCRHALRRSVRLCTYIKLTARS